MDKYKTTIMRMKIKNNHIPIIVSSRCPETQFIFIMILY